MPKVSVIIPCYNSEKFIGQAIQSVIEQSLEDWEVIVVDDGSTDSSFETISLFVENNERVRCIRQENRGVAAARNKGASECGDDSELFLFLDADDVLEPAMLMSLASYMELNPHVGLARCQYDFINEDGENIEVAENKQRFVPHGLWVRALAETEPNTPFASIFTLCGIIPSISLIRRSHFEQSGGFDQDFGHHHEDADFFLRLSLISEVHYVPGVLVRRRTHAAQNTADSPEFRDKVRAQEAKLYRKWCLEFDGSSQNRRIIANAWHFKHGRLEPYLAFARAHNYLKNKELGKSMRFYLGGFRRYLLSFIPGYRFPL